MTRQRHICNRRSLLPIGVGVLALAVLGCAAQADDKAPATQVKARITGTIHSEPVAKLNAEEWRAVSLAAGRILKHTAQARWAIAEKKNEEATAYIDKGLTLVRIIENAVPKRTVTAEIKSGDIVYEDQEEVGPALVPIYDELDHVELMAPVVRAKNKNADKATSKEEGKGSDTPEPPAEIVPFEGLEYSAAELNVFFAKDMLTRAKKEIGEGKTEDADNALWAIQARGVSFEFDEVSLPLERAANNLKLAEFEMKEGWSEDAKVALKSASDALKKYEQFAGESRSKEVRSLNKEIDQLTKSLEKKHDEQDVAKAKKKVSSWWDRVGKWFKK